MSTTTSQCGNAGTSAEKPPSASTAKGKNPSNVGSNQGIGSSPPNLGSSGKPKHKSFPGTPLSYLAAPIALAFAVLLSIVFRPIIPYSPEYIFLLSVIATGWVAGRGPGLVTAILAPLTLDYFFLPPLHMLGFSAEAGRLMFPFLLFAICAAWLSSARRDAENAKSVIRANEERFRDILTNLPDVAWTADTNGKFLYISPKIEELTGFTSEEVYAGGLKLLLANVHPEDLSPVQKAAEDLFIRGLAFDIEFRFQKNSGDWIWLHNRTVGAFHRDSAVLADGVINDISYRKEAEIELKSKTALLEAQVNSTIDGILVVDSHDQRILQNRRFHEIFNLPPEYRSIGEDKPVREHVCSLVKDSKTFSAKIEYLTAHPMETSRDELELKDGTILDRCSSPVVGEDGKYYGRIWTFRDMTLRKRHEDQLRQLSLAVEQSPAAVVITDPKGNITYVNRKFTESTGYAAEYVVGKNPRILKSGYSTPGDYENLWNTITRGGEWRGELRNKKKNEELYWEAATITPILDSSGTITHFLALKEDITERKKNENQLRQLSLAVEQSPVAVVMMDPQGIITYVNRRQLELTGYTQDEVIGKQWISLHTDPSSQERYKALWKTVRQGKEWHGELCNRKKDGQVYWAAAAVTPILDRNGAIIHFVALKEDITERRVMEAQLRQAQKLEGIGQLAAGIAHEINTPIQFVSDNLVFLRDSWTATAKLLEEYRKCVRSCGDKIPAEVVASLAHAEGKLDLEFISTEAPRAIDQGLDGARRVAKIVKAMKEFSHPDSAEKVQVDLNKAIESTITVARNEWKYAAEINTDFDPALPQVVCYPGEVNQVFLNLIVNAAHSIQEKVKENEKGRITVCTRGHGEFAEVAITDTGTGIPNEIQTRIFEPFFTTKEVGKGTGQGLALAHSVVVKKHHGKIWFNTQMGVGTTFFIDLPFDPDCAGKEN